MGDQTNKRASLYSRFWRWGLSKLTHDVPEDIARCEFDCRQSECRYSKWATCENRLREIKKAK